MTAGMRCKIQRKDNNMAKDQKQQPRKTIHILKPTWDRFYQCWLKVKLHNPALTQGQMFSAMIDSYEREQAGDASDTKVTI